jgi:hypothetical protein
VLSPSPGSRSNDNPDAYCLIGGFGSEIPRREFGAVFDRRQPDKTVIDSPASDTEPAQDVGLAR